MTECRRGRGDNRIDTRHRLPDRDDGVDLITDGFILIQAPFDVLSCASRTRTAGVQPLVDNCVLGRRPRGRALFGELSQGEEFELVAVIGLGLKRLS